ncbi:uncharacterized protein LOC112568095 isoform X2 [Pomacea canaliculata]|uniref:uncharacterized protein LOC112568095 isoform X2 n=1 Tax=Pomacea canaliculata TaxID=400727 RepID=UPI000D733B05|nr:uncharacterized protein LOC112568095 isoform X2 [Pomacea canaliculata]
MCYPYKVIGCEWLHEDFNFLVAYQVLSGAVYICVTQCVSCDVNDFCRLVALRWDCFPPVCCYVQSFWQSTNIIVYNTYLDSDCSHIMPTLIGLICVLCIRATYVVTVSLCKDGKYLEVKEGRDDNRFVCTGLTAEQTVSWFWGTTFILKCTASACEANYFSTYFKISRSLPTESDITVNATSLSDLGNSALANLTCHVSGDNKDTCQLDVVYPAENPQCQIQFSGDTWEVISHCTVSKVRSRRDRYGCYLYQISEQLTALFLGTFTTSLKPSSKANYFSGECQIKITLPSEGKYNYSVIIIPGEVQVFPSFNGSNEIRRPSESPQHNCPRYVTESGDINCLCYSDNLGLPSGSLIWRGTNSPKLTLDQVNRTYSGTSNTCILMWNNTAVQSTQYTVTVNYASRVLSFKIDNKADDIVTVKENTNVSVVCQAEGRQLPTIHLFKRSSDNQDLELASTNNTLELQYTMTAVKCETTAIYTCKSENNISGDQKYIRLIVSCAPRQTMHDSYSVTFNGDKARLHFKFLADPAPNVLSIFSIKSSLNDTTSRKVEYQNRVEFDCKSDQLYRYMVTCTVTLLNKTAFRPGVYDAVFSNDLGNISLTFEIKEQVDSTGQSKSEVAGPVAGGVIGAFAVITLVVSAVFFIRRKRRKPDERGLQTNQVLTPKTSERSLETLYDHLQRGDINNPSVYQTLEPLHAPKYKDQGKSHEAPIDLHENTRGTRHKEIIYQNTTFC